MKIAINVSALGDDLDLSPFEKLGECKFFGDITRKELFELCADADALIVNKLEVDEKLLDACPSIKYVGTFATQARFIPVTISPSDKLFMSIAITSESIVV